MFDPRPSKKVRSDAQPTIATPASANVSAFTTTPMSSDLTPGASLEDRNSRRLHNTMKYADKDNKHQSHAVMISRIFS